MRNTNTQVRQTALTAVLAAVVLLMAFTPLGYLRIGPVSITFLVIPVVIGGMTLGPCGAASWALCSGLPASPSASWATPLARHWSR